MRHIFGLILGLLAGCNTIELTKIRTNKEYLDIDTQLKKHFTPEAQKALTDIKIYEGLHINSYVVGVNFWSNLISFLTFNGLGRKIISSQGTLSDGCVDTVIHEYMHQLDDMDRDGEIEIIDQLAFWKAFLQMHSDAATQEITNNILDKSDQTVTNIFGIGPVSEVIAYTASWIVENPDLCPLYMHQVFADVLVVSRSKMDLDS